MSERPPPTPWRISASPHPPESFSSVGDAVTPINASDSALNATSAALDTLKNVLESANTLPCIKYIASVGVKILEIIDEVQTVEKTVRSVGMRARDIVLAVARACEGAQIEMQAQLENDLKQLTDTMAEILRFTQEMAARSKYKKLLYKSQDADAAKALDIQLTHAFRIFEIQSSVNIRISQQQVVQHLSGMSIASPVAVTTHLLCVPEGLYTIRSAWDDRIIESEHNRPSPAVQHVYAAPSSRANEFSPYRLWVIFKKDGSDSKYHIRSFATGLALDVDMNPEWRNHVVCSSSHRQSNQTWEFYGSRQTQTMDFCSIRSMGPHTVLDAKCPAGSDCDYLHQTELSHRLGPAMSQEWSLVHFPFSALPTRPSASLTQSHDILVRREYKLQNVASGQFMVAIGLNSSTNEPNIVAKTDISDATSWYFIHTTEDQDWTHYEDMFAIVTGSGAHRATLDQWFGHFVKASYGSFSTTNTCHMWKVIPRSDGAYTFRNFFTDHLLGQSQMTGEVAPTPATLSGSPACQWRLVDASTGDICRVLYDSTLSIIPPELDTEQVSAPATLTPSEPVLRTESASPPLHRQFFDKIERDHEFIREMLGSGYTSLVVAPQLVRGWKNGRVHNVVVQEEDEALRAWKLKGKDNFDYCRPG